MKHNQKPEAKDMALLDIISPLKSTARIPIEYCIDGISYRGIPSNLHPLEKTEVCTNGSSLKKITGFFDDLEISVEYITYPDFPVTEWVVYITNKGDKPSPILSSLKIIPTIFPGTNPIMRLGMGDGYVAEENVFKDYLEPLIKTKTVNPIKGRSCNGASPYMRLLFDTYGINIAVGWPAQWKADYTRTENGAALSVCQERLNTTILPGETIRSPRLTLMAFTGGELRGANLWRRWFIKYILVKENGKPLRPKITSSEKPLKWPDDPRNLKYKEDSKFKDCCVHELCSSEQQIEAIENYLAVGIKPDVWWIDAGWYECEYKWKRIGTWKHNVEQYPNGLHEIGEICEKNNIDFLLWFEPERVKGGTELDIDHPSWLLRRRNHITFEQAEKKNRVVSREEIYMLDFSQPDCVNWITERLDSIIKEGKVKVYREDFNMCPLEWWEDNETPDRIGALENAYVIGFLNMWKELLKRNPGLWIDSCASGGRRNDLETLRTPAVPLHYTDHSYGNHPLKLGHARYMHQWIPYFKGHNTMDWDDENGHYPPKKVAMSNKVRRPNNMFRHYTSLGTMVCADCYYDSPEDIKLQKHLIDIAYRAGEIMLSGDYYPLTKYNRTEYEWFADQFDADNEGYILFVRNTCAEEGELTVKPFLDENVAYSFENSESGEFFEMSGIDASNGLSIRLPKRSGVILFYKKVIPDIK